MNYFYSPSTEACYADEIHDLDTPTDAFPISIETYDQILLERSRGRVVKATADNKIIFLAQIAPSVDILETAARHIREQQLLTTDWTQGKDVPEATSSVWGVYRQALRDITSQPGFPSKITWPLPPNQSKLPEFFEKWPLIST